ncbi:myb/SANT-like DNA-binding domain-containing protein 2 isoform X5 [Nannospalax galili]|uniref:myb/SANT-like DNA-binding domain-containing protein 2 isoform X5 n=1 Tax=Nannospalax galili TaxID=1026970 RepID=UPI00111C4152|nr:myb/SANT-like DNA-binding domain-containing protein 2 isoform X5 [Nannospalax galili]XP_029420418.1 myb/SANT-like DNA-binding domain-containing protein 2 isoform X5 [Nannospalax galili]
MAAPCGSELPANSPLKIPKMEVLSPASPGDLSDGNPSLSDSSTPRGASPLGPGSAAGSGAAASGGLGLGGRSAASSSVSFSPGGGGSGAAAAAAAACRGMSWTPAETNALIAVWGNERLVEARYQQLEGAGTVFGSKAPGPAMYERVSRALAELGYERTPSQCRERIKPALLCSQVEGLPGCILPAGTGLRKDSRGAVCAHFKIFQEYLVGMLHCPVMRRKSKAKKEIEPLKNLEDQFTCLQTAGSMPRTECCAPAVASPVLNREEEPPS